MVYELTHALQDQYFDRGNIIKAYYGRHNNDCILAHTALWEGDATAVMMEYHLEPAKKHFADLPDLALVMKLQTSLMQEQFPVLKGAPSFMRDTLLFPTGYGAFFLQQVWKQNPSWQSINKIYSDLPASTEQIMHPEKYYASRDEPRLINAEALTANLSKDWEIVYENVLGEYSLGLLLSLHLSEEHAMKAATGWGGDRVLLLENESGKDAVLIGATWDTVSDAEKFFSAMAEWFKRHYTDTERTEISPTGYSYSKDGEYGCLQRTGASVQFFIGLPAGECSNREK